MDTYCSLPYCLLQQFSLVFSSCPQQRQKPLFKSNIFPHSPFIFSLYAYMCNSVFQTTIVTTKKMYTYKEVEARRHILKNNEVKHRNKIKTQLANAAYLQSPRLSALAVVSIMNLSIDLSTEYLLYNIVGDGPHSGTLVVHTV